MSTTTTLSIRGKLFQVRKETFQKYPDSLLGAAVSRDLPLADTVDTPQGKALFFDRDPSIFQRVVLSLYTYGYWPWHPTDVASIVYEELCYWGLAPSEYPTSGDDVADYPTFLGLALSTLEHGDDYTFTRDPSEKYTKHNPYTTSFSQAATYLVAYEDKVKSTALLRGTWLNLTKVQGYPQVQERNYRNSYSLSGSDLVVSAKLESHESKSIAEVGPNVLLPTSSTKRTTFTFGGKEYVLHVDCRNTSLWKMQLRTPEDLGHTWPHDLIVDVRGDDVDFQGETHKDFFKWGHEIGQLSLSGGLGPKAVCKDKAYQHLRALLWVGKPVEDGFHLNVNVYNLHVKGYTSGNVVKGVRVEVYKIA